MLHCNMFITLICVILPASNDMMSSFSSIRKIIVTHNRVNVLFSICASCFKTRILYAHIEGEFSVKLAPTKFKLYIFFGELYVCCHQLPKRGRLKVQSCP